jgi:hypothetical protein
MHHYIVLTVGLTAFLVVVGVVFLRWVMWQLDVALRDFFEFPQDRWDI